MHKKPPPRSAGIAAAICFGLVSALAITPSLNAQTSVTTPTINVTGEPVATPHPHDDTRPKLEHIMREVSETQITVTKKATVIPLDKEAPKTIAKSAVVMSFSGGGTRAAAPGVAAAADQASNNW